jgi:hypothetical protein
MTTVNFTQRIKDVISRQLKVDFCRIMTKVQEQFDSNDDKDGDEIRESTIAYNEDLEIRITPDIETHQTDCDGFPYTLVHDCFCSNVRDVTIMINITYKGNSVYTFKLKEMPLENMIERIQADFPASITICQCGDEAIEDSKCRRCYIHSYTRTEEEGGACSICLENDGLWFKTKCGHIFHQHCLLKAIDVSNSRRCPLCRADINYSILLAGVNPYNV